jgi:hypothetical protein
MPRRYIILAISIVTSIGLFYLSQAILTHIWIPPNAGVLDSFFGGINAAYYSYLGVFLLLVVGSLLGILIGWRKRRQELRLGAIFSLGYAIVVTVVVIILLNNNS